MEIMNAALGFFGRLLGAYVTSLIADPFPTIGISIIAIAVLLALASRGH
jgi:hypothetical protein